MDTCSTHMKESWSNFCWGPGRDEALFCGHEFILDDDAGDRSAACGRGLRLSFAMPLVHVIDLMSSIGPTSGQSTSNSRWKAIRDQLMKFWPRAHQQGKMLQMTSTLFFGDEIDPISHLESMESDASLCRRRLCILDWGLVTNLDPSFRVAQLRFWVRKLVKDFEIGYWMLHEVAYIEHIAHLVSGASNSGMDSNF